VITGQGVGGPDASFGQDVRARRGVRGGGAAGQQDGEQQHQRCELGEAGDESRFPFSRRHRRQDSS